MTAPSITQLLAGIPGSLGAYAPVIAEIETALQSPECSLVTVAEAIEKEPDLTARLLRLGNSSFYGFSSRLTTVNEAISLIGIQQAQDLIQVSAIIEQFAGVPPDFVSMESFWRHSLACGIGARLLAMEKRLPKPDKFFAAGLLHDVGRLVLFSQAPKAAQRVFELYRSERLLLREAEERMLGFDHQQIGEALLRLWQYPAPLVQAIACHHRPAAGDSASNEAAIVHLADHLVNAMQIGSSGERYVPPLQTKAWDSLRLSPNVLSSVITGIDQQLEAVQDAFLKIRPAGTRWMSDAFESVYPDLLRTGLEKLATAESRRDLLALFSALENFRRELHTQESVTGILQVSQSYVGGLNLFRVAGFWLVNPADFSFEQAQCGPADERDALAAIVTREIRGGRFGWALRQSSPVFFQPAAGPMVERGLLHSLALSSQVVGMFAGVLRQELAPNQEIHFSLLSMLLGDCADALATLHKTTQLTNQIKTLSGLLPVCAWCKKVRDDHGYWEQIECYVAAHSDAEFTHAICPDCRTNFLASSSLQK